VIHAAATTLKDLPGWPEFLEGLAGALEPCRQADAQLGVLVVKLHNLRKINNGFGLAVGDRALERLLRGLLAIKREQDLVARIGGAGFGLILPLIRSEGQAILAATKLWRVLRDPLLEARKAVDLDIRIGIALFPNHGNSVEDLLLRADQALQIAIRGNKLYRVFTGDDDGAERDSWNLERDLKRAIENDELELVYQPKIDLVTGGLVGLEAFARWNHPLKGMLGARSFAVLIETTGLLHTFNWWALKTALRQASERPGPWNRLPVSVNVALRMLEDPDFAEMLGETLGLWGVSPDRLTLELIESEHSLDLEKVLHNLERLEQIGIHLAVDNFGDGRDALALVRLLTIDQIDQIKIPLSLTRQIKDKDQGNDRSDRIVQTIIDLAHRMNIAVVAGGIEDSQALQTLAGLGCDYGQGYFIARPMPHAELEDWLANRG
jgi:diguanylate cyclase